MARPLPRRIPPALFLTGYGERFSPAYLGNWVKKLLKRCGIDKPGSCHLWRHSCATDMHRGGADIRYVQEMLGHERMEWSGATWTGANATCPQGGRGGDHQTTQIYTHVHIDALREIHARCHPHGRLDETHDLYDRVTTPPTSERDLPSRDVPGPLQIASNMVIAAPHPVVPTAPSAAADQLRPELPPDEDRPIGGAPATGPEDDYTSGSTRYIDGVKTKNKQSTLGEGGMPCKCATDKDIEDCVNKYFKAPHDTSGFPITNNCGSDVRDAFTSCCLEDPTPWWLYYPGGSCGN